MDEEKKTTTFKPNRELTKKADQKLGLKRSPERIDKYITDFNERSKKQRQSEKSDRTSQQSSTNLNLRQ